MSPSILTSPVTLSHPWLCSWTPAATSLPLLHKDPVDHRDFHSLKSLLCPGFKLHQQLPGNAQATLSRKTSRLTAVFHLFTHSSMPTHPCPIPQSQAHLLANLWLWPVLSAPITRAPTKHNLVKHPTFLPLVKPFCHLQYIPFPTSQIPIPRNTFYMEPPVPTPIKTTDFPTGNTQPPHSPKYQWRKRN